MTFDVGGQAMSPVLIADDSPVNQEVASGLLELFGHCVSKASSGREAIEAWERETFDVILMDVEMHDIDGLTATATIREREAATGRRTPIIALTAHTYKGFEERCREAGMDGHISKPLHPDELFRVLAAADNAPRTGNRGWTVLKLPVCKVAPVAAQGRREIRPQIPQMDAD